MERLSVKLYHLLNEAFENQKSKLKVSLEDKFDEFEENFINTLGWLPQLDDSHGKIFDTDDTVYARVIKELGVYDEFCIEINKAKNEKDI